MPTYDYKCNATGEVVEVRHGMNELLHNWGQLCERSGHNPGLTPKDAVVSRLATGGQIVKRSSLGDSAAPTCNVGPCCGGGMCE